MAHKYIKTETINFQHKIDVKPGQRIRAGLHVK